jgi:hypothetical protein
MKNDCICTKSTLKFDSSKNDKEISQK